MKIAGRKSGLLVTERLPDLLPFGVLKFNMAHRTQIKRGSI